MERPEISCLVSKMRDFSVLGDREEAMLTTHRGEQKGFAVRSQVYFENAPVLEASVLKKGWFSAFNLLSNGKRSLTNLYLPGDVNGTGSMPCSWHTSGLITLTTGALTSSLPYALLRYSAAFPDWHHSPLMLIPV